MENLGIDIKILLAQVINFLLLFVVFRKFVYRPFLNSIKEQEEKEKSAIKKIEAYEKKEKELYERKVALEEAYEDKLKKMYAKMKKETNEAKRQILKDAQVEAEEIRKHNMELIESEREKMYEEVKKEASQIALALAEKAIRETVGGDLQKQITKEVARKLPKVKHAD